MKIKYSLLLCLFFSVFHPACTEEKGSPEIPEIVVVPPEIVVPEVLDNNEGMVSNAKDLAAKMKAGWNLGNSLEATGLTGAGETTWGNPKTSKQLIDAVKAAGFNAIRIPCAWNAYIEDQTTYKIKSEWLARVKEVVDYCIDNGMYTIINIHWDGGWLEDNPFYAKQEEVNKKQKALWTQIAGFFKDYDEHLLFAGTNEVHAGYGTPSAENIAVQSSYNQTFVDAVRATGGKNARRNLVVQAYNTNIDNAVKYLKMPDDNAKNRLMAEVHYYDPWDFCGDESSSIYLWGKNYSGKNVSTWGQEAYANEQFVKMKTNFVDKGIPVILGEYGAIIRTKLPSNSLAEHIQARNYYLNYITKTARENGCIPFYWDNGNTGNNGFGLFGRATGAQVYPDAIQAIVK
jgi:endoglucanase